ncbi:MAG: ExbD/TolR family protein [Opitutales bacterium]
MPRKPRKQRDETEINITPMLDVVFIMLIFFIVTTSFVKETGIEVSRPDAETAVLKQRGNILVGVRSNGDIWIDKQQRDPRAVRTVIERIKAENPEGEVVIVSDQSADSKVVIDVMDQLAAAGILKVYIATNPNN